MFARCAPPSRYTLLFSHGNAVDLGQMCSFYIGLGSRINCNIFSYDYSGYGVSSGKPSEKNLYADIDAAWQALRTRERKGFAPCGWGTLTVYAQLMLGEPRPWKDAPEQAPAVKELVCREHDALVRGEQGPSLSRAVVHKQAKPVLPGKSLRSGLTRLLCDLERLSRQGTVTDSDSDSSGEGGGRYGVSPENIILYGQSIGTVPTVDLASRYECAAVILHSPLMSGLRVAFPDTRKTYCFDAFPSIDKISKVTSPVLVIHGTEDEVIDFSHGLAMYERCPRAVEPLWVEGAGHNDIELYAQYLERLKQFISHELPNS
ncbi:Abhydrolase domain-containing protein FAM108C1 [Tupaia chinensis]|uniref:Alpha/beta hydrolase domain-containing protein 17C n=1 Tax=Tupaia chinensis TaxID=246437 RepID=L9L6T4_TUPCH|nr:Abhydrolase domain-containing protein FAM108C1 [Tupaia chinensis]